MIFEVTRTSNNYNLKRNIPHEKCILIKLKLVDKHKFLTPELYDKNKPSNCKKWFDDGTNHRTEDDCIVRDLEEKEVWGIEINSLEELLEFVNEVDHEVIISRSLVDCKTPSLEIYDDWRE